MATLVLSTVGNVLGGPVGGAIGALIGQSIDQQLLGSPRRGPRVGDLSVQSSSYGSQMPRVYGTMRVAGSVVWSTDLIESEQTAGAKGQPDISYSYSVSFAVALSSRGAKSVKRIWADGKLLRGEAGDFKTSTTFRFYDGNEDQPVDPLIGSIEGIASTLAYRGLALAVFENLQLADFGNRIPFLTFEVEADDVPPTIASIFADSSGGLIQSGASQSVIGFAAYGASIKDAVQPLMDCFGVELFDDGSQIRGPNDSGPLSIDDEQLGNSAGNSQTPKLHRQQLPISSVPAALRLSYYDPARDYQTSEARADAGEIPGNDTQQELPAVLNAGDSKSLVHAMLARAWANRDQLTLRLPPAQLGLEPGAVVDLPLNPSSWIVTKLTIDGFVVVAELRPSPTSSVFIAADAGRIVPNADVAAGPLQIALIDIPNVFEPGSNQPILLLAATNSTAGWKRRPVAISYGGQIVTSDTARSKSVMGSAATILADGGADLIDEQSSVDVTLVDADQWLTSCDDDALAAGINLAVLGSELIQYGSAEDLGGGRFRLTRLLRGRGGTEWASGGHAAGELFCLVEPASLRSLPLPSWGIGADIEADVDSISDTVTFTGESVRPVTPIDLQRANQSNGDLVLSWTRRSRQGFAWIDGVDAPLGESSEQYRVSITGPTGSVEMLVGEPTATVSASDLAGLGLGPASIEVRQIGDVAASHPAQTSINLS